MVSIIIPHYNRSSLLRDSIQSVLEQSVTDWEIIVIDDNSELTEWNTIQSYEEIDKRISVYQRTFASKGPSACRNEGVAKSKYSFLIFLDSDDLLKPFCVQQRLQIMLDHPHLNMSVFLEENFSEVPGDLKTNFNLGESFDRLIPSFIQNNNPWQTMAPIWKKDFFLKVGGFDEELIYMEDPELHIRALIDSPASIQICYNNPADCFYRINHNDNEKKDFYYNSIKYRILFYGKVLTLLVQKRLLHKYAKNVKSGLYHLLRIFLYSRKNEYPELYKSYITLVKNCKLFNKIEVFKIRFLCEIGNSNLKSFSFLKIRGICYRLLPRQ